MFDKAFLSIIAATQISLIRSLIDYHLKARQEKVKENAFRTFDIPA